MTLRYYVNHAPQKQLAGSITNSSATCSVTSALTGWPSSFPFYAELDRGTASAEIVLVTAISGTTVTMTRGQDGDAAVSHPAGATLDFVVAAIDIREANAHVNATTGVHGVSGHVVGDSDAQTLTNKTLTAPVLDGNVTSTDGTVNVSGNIDATGTLHAAGAATLSSSLAVTGAATGGSFAANGDGHVSGVLVAKSYTNEAAATTAGANSAGAVVNLTNPTTGQPGLYAWNGTAWKQIPVAGDMGYVGEVTSSSAVTLSTTSAFAGLATITFTLARQTRIKISGIARYNPGSSGGNLRVQAGYNSGSSATIGSFTGVGQIWNSASDSAKAHSGLGIGTALLAAGTYTAYLSLTRVGGSATDTADNFSVLVEALGNV